MEVTLTHGAIGKMINGEVTSEKEMTPVMQVTQLRHLGPINTPKGRWSVLFSDGTHLQQVGVLNTTHNTLVEQGFLQTGSIVRLTQFRFSNIQGRNFIVVLNLEVISNTSKIIRYRVLGPNPNDTQDGEVSKQAVFEKMKDLEVISTKSHHVIGPNPNDTSCFDAPIPSKSSLGRLVLPDTPVLKQDVLKKLKAFRERLSSAKLFIHDTRTSKDQIRATIRCSNELINCFNNVWEEFRGAEDEFELIQRGVHTSFDDSEDLGCDQLRSNACTLLKFFREKSLNSFVKAFSPFVTIECDETKKALLAIQKVVEEGDSLVYRVMYEGFDCKSIVEDEEDDEW